MARPQAATFTTQRDDILRAAAALFAARGYTATTMNELAKACGVSKALLYHYVRDKHDLLVQISLTHVATLEALVADVLALKLAPEPHLRLLIERFTAAYAHAQNEHRVLTEDVRFLGPEERVAVLGAQRRVVDAFAAAIQALRPELAGQRLSKPLTMLLFGMINWTFTWMKPGAGLTHQALAPMVSELFLGGLHAVALPHK
jgi:AcrR family transcriptional regulator